MEVEKINSLNFDKDQSLLPDAVSLQEKDFIFSRLLGFFDIKALYIAIKYDFFSIIEKSSCSIVEISEKTKLPERSVKFILISLIGMKLCTVIENEYYSATPVGTKFFSKNSSFYLGSYVDYLSWLFDALPNFSDGILNDKPIWDGYEHYLKLFGKSDLANNMKIMNDAMTSSQLLLCHRILSHVNLEAHSKLLDIGGGYGRFSATAITRFPDMKATIFELPELSNRAKETINNWHMSDKINLLTGNFEEDPWPTGYDIISFIRIFTTRSEALISHLLKKAFDALPSGGGVIFADTAVLPANLADTGLLGSRLSLIYQMSSFGNVRTLTEWINLVTTAGFETPSVAKVEDPYGFIYAVKP